MMMKGLRVLLTAGVPDKDTLERWYSLHHVLSYIPENLIYDQDTAFAVIQGILDFLFLVACINGNGYGADLKTGKVQKQYLWPVWEHEPDPVSVADTEPEKHSCRSACIIVELTVGNGFVLKEYRCFIRRFKCMLPDKIIKN